MCFGCSKEPSHRDGSFEYPQHMFWVRNKEKKIIFQYALLSGCLELRMTLHVILQLIIRKLIFCDILSGEETVSLRYQTTVLASHHPKSATYNLQQSCRFFCVFFFCLFFFSKITNKAWYFTRNFWILVKYAGRRFSCNIISFFRK